ncbi:uncharacterized protein LOC8258527 [Ricinus communis]|uniref:Acyl-CoA thioesterase, putative n=1 Tax=Ricinus communis TaxID=3988 RepID=B9RDM0_RICCO|nr:uncharacterized protein LOC8258527 [Ricinus communis]EEF50478.1 acyl-CoA thioesterase, putative [Ricinus communis]|eukprot:XP_002511809.1 uncharacterized protein LOC8258527 [Ricinus communis]
MAKPSKTCTSLTLSSSASATSLSKDLPPQYVAATRDFLIDTGIYSSLSDKYSSKDSYSHLIRHLLSTDIVQRGHVSCVFTVLPFIINIFNGLFGGAIGGIAERVAIACARTVVGQEKELFLGELSISYLSAARQNDVVVVDGSVVRSGRNLSAVVIEFRIKKSLKLLYTADVTLYHLPIAKL